MKKNLLSMFVLFTAVSLACSVATNAIPSGTATDGTPPAANAQADGFSAEATAEGGVLLKWEPIGGAEKYLLEVQIGDEFVALASVPAEQTSYEDTNVPPDTRFTYRLSSIAGTERGESKELTIETPPEVSNPLKVSIEFDKAPAAIDITNIDPSTIDPDTFDPDNFDPSQFMPQPVQTQAVIGPQGGEISVTGSNGVIYTLNVPLDALRFEVTITLRPISAIPDLPLGGGLMAAVFVEPETLVFDIPATLKMTPPADFPDAAGPLIMAFASEADGQEFHFYPRDMEAGQSSLGGHLASLRTDTNFAGPLADALKVQDGGVYGQGSGTAQDVQEVAKKSPSKSKNRTAQRVAVGQLEVLEPLTPIDEDKLAPLQPKIVVEFGKIGEAILQKVGQADDWSKFMEALDDFNTYLDAGGDKFEFNKKLNDKILDLLADKARQLLDKNKGGCLTADDFKAQELLEQLTNPKSSFSKAFAVRFKQKHGQPVFDELVKARITCSFELTMNSTLTFEAESSVLRTVASVPKLELFPVYANGKIYLTGEGKMVQDFRVTGICSFPLKHYDSLTFFVGELSPVFDKDGMLIDFNLSQYAVHGWNERVSISAAEDGKGCPTMVKINGGGDYWTALFMAARSDKGGSQEITGWEVQTSLAADDSFHSLQADWISVKLAFVPFNVAGSKSSEDTKFNLKVTKNSK